DPHGVGQLTVFPDTPQNRAYAQLLRREKALNIRTWGIGVEMYSNGRPHEQLTRWPEMKEPTAAATSSQPEAPVKPAGPPFPWWWIALGLLALIAIAVWLNMNRPV